MGWSMGSSPGNNNASAAMAFWTFFAKEQHYSNLLRGLGDEE
jgi:hypothetical protein